MASNGWCAGMLSGFMAIAATLAGCGSGTCGGASGASDVCPPPVYGHAQVRGRVLRSDGSVVTGKPAYVACGDAVGAYSDMTDGNGQFHVRLQYAVFDTVLYPFPPRTPNGNFDLACTGSLAVNSTVLIVKNALVVHFAPSQATVVPTETEWREGVP